MSRSAIRSAILALQCLVAAAAAGGTALGAAVYLDGRGDPDGFGDVVSFLGAAFAAWCLVVLVAAAATIHRLWRDRPGPGVLAVLTGVLGLLPVILLGANEAPAVLLCGPPFAALVVLGFLETFARED